MSDSRLTAMRMWFRHASLILLFISSDSIGRGCATSGCANVTSVVVISSQRGAVRSTRNRSLAMSLIRDALFHSMLLS